MQTDLGSPVETVTASFIYAVRYSYSDSVINNDNQLRILPRDGEGQFDLDTEVWSIPAGRGVDFKDRFGNQVRRLRVMQPHTTFIVAAAGRLQLSTGRPSARDLPLSALQYASESLEYVAVSPLVDANTVVLSAAEAAGGCDTLLTTVEAVVQWVYKNILYRRGTTSVATTADQVLAAGEGVCQDKNPPVFGHAEGAQDTLPVCEWTHRRPDRRNAFLGGVLSPRRRMAGSRSNPRCHIASCQRLREAECGTRLYRRVACNRFLPVHGWSRGNCGHSGCTAGRLAAHAGRCAGIAEWGPRGAKRVQYRWTIAGKTRERLMTNTSDPRTIARTATDRWLTDSRVCNLVWLGRWVERAQTIARVVRWAAMQDSAADQPEIGTTLRMAASIRGLTVREDETALDLLLTRDSGASLRGCLLAARSRHPTWRR